MNKNVIKFLLKKPVDTSDNPVLKGIDEIVKQEKLKEKNEGDKENEPT